MSELKQCQVAVVGSGPGGAVTAATLSEQGLDVVLLEEGPRLNLDSCQAFSIEELRQKYRCGGLNPAMGAPRLALVEACCVGGGSEINSGLYHRTPPELLQLWRERYQVRSLEEADLLPHFQACEAELSVQCNPGAASAASIKMKTGAERLGWKTLEVPRWVKYAADGQGRRQSMTETCIPCAERKGCQVLPDARVDRLERGTRGWRIKIVREGKPLEIEAEAAFVCCGAVGTPALLRRSGIRKNVGNSLAVHPTIKAVAIFEDEVNSNYADVPTQQVREFSPLISMGCSISSPPYLALAMTDHPHADVDVRRWWRRMAIYYAMITGPNTGVVRNLPLSPVPLIRYRLGAGDLRSLATALRQLCRLLLAAGATEVYPSVAGMPVIKSEDDLTRIPAELPRNRTNLMTIHLFSSCPMGEAREVCAADSFGQVHGCPNLFVNDASMLCTAPGVNPQGSIMAVARRNALHFCKRL